MSLRHSHHPAERDVRMHDPHPHQLGHPSSAPPPPPPPHGPPPHQVHMNGSVPNTPAVHANGIVSHGPPHAAPGGPGVLSPNGAPPPPPGHANGAPSYPATQKLAKANEETWLLIGSVAEQMGDSDRALSAYENALRHNPHSLEGLTQVAGIARIRENYSKAIEYFQRALTVQQENGEVWSSLGHCYLMQDDLQKAYSAYQQALYLLPNPKEDPKLWYGIGILYDRYGSLDHAEEAFASVLQMDKGAYFDKANEILFRLGIIYKQQGKYQESLECFDRILRNPPSPLAHADIWFQIGHVYEQQKDHTHAKDAYERVVIENPHHAKVLQQLGWLYHQDGCSFQNQDLAITYLTKSLEADPGDAQSWYLLGRAYMAGQKYNKAYEAYQQAVYRDGRNPTFWCSIGVLYFQINQYRDALDAYSRAIRINPYISEVWFDLGSLYESCNNQISDAIDAYARASELDPGNHMITERLHLLRNAQATGGQLPAAPNPQDVHPTAYASAVGPPVTIPGSGPLMMHTGTGPPRPIFSRSDSREHLPENGMPAQSPHSQAAPPPFRGGPPPPVVLDESRRAPIHTPLAPMDVDRREGAVPPYARENSSSRGPSGHQSLLLHHPQPQPEHHQPRPADPFYGRPRGHSNASATSPPPPQRRGQHEPPPYHGYPNGTSRSSAPGQPPVPSQRSPRYSHYEAPPAASPPPGRVDSWEAERRAVERGRPRGDSRGEPTPVNFRQPRIPGSPMSAHPYESRRPSPPPSTGPRPISPRGYPVERSPVVAPSGPGGPSRWIQNSGRYAPDIERSPPHPSHLQHSPQNMPASRRYDPRFDETQAHRERFIEREPESYEARSHSRTPEIQRGGRAVPLAPQPEYATPLLPDRRRPGRNGKDRDSESVRGPTPGPAQQQIPSSSSIPLQASGEKKRRGRGVNGRRGKDDSSIAGSRAPSVQPASFKVNIGGNSPASPEPVSSASASGSARSGRPSPTAVTQPPARVVDENYDEGVADTLMNLRHPPPEGPISPVSARGRASPPPPAIPGNGGLMHHGHSHSRSMSHGHRNSISSTTSRHSPTMSTHGSVHHNSLKRPFSPGPSTGGMGGMSEHGIESKRSRVDSIIRRASPPQPSSRPSPIPFRTQPSRSPDDRHQRSPTSAGSAGSGATMSTGLPASLPLPPPPSAVVVAPGASNGNGPTTSPLTHPAIATLSPTGSSSTGPLSPSAESDRMQVDREIGMGVKKSRSRSLTPRGAASTRASPQSNSRSPPKDKSASPRS